MYVAHFRARTLFAMTLFASLSSSAMADGSWASFATVSDTIGVANGRTCVGGTLGDIGCPSYAPSLTTAGDMSVTGNLSASKFIGDGSSLTGIATASSDRIVSGSTSMLAVSSTGYVSLTQ